MFVNEEYEIVYPKNLRHFESEGILISPTNYQYGLIGLREQIGDIYLLKIFTLYRESRTGAFEIKDEITTFTFNTQESLSTFFQRLPGMTAFEYLLFKNYH